MSEINDPESIIAQARAAVTARRTTEAQQRWHGQCQWLLPLVAASVPITFFLAPGALVEKMLLLMGGICGLRPDHSYFLGGVQLPLEARDTGIYVGFLVTFVTLLPRLGARRLGGRFVQMLLTLFFVGMVFDGTNSTVATIGLQSLYESTNLTRLLTGLLSGIATGAFLVWLLSVVALPRTKDDAARGVVCRTLDLGVLLVLCGALALVVLSGTAMAYYPIALLSVGGAVGILCVAVLLLTLHISGLVNRITVLKQVFAPTALALLIAYILLGASAAYRWMTIGTIPF